MSFLRHGEIYRPISSESKPGQPYLDRPGPHRYDEFPAGYSLAGCAPAEPASASPAEAHREAGRSGGTIEKQRTVGSVLTACLTQRDNPISHLETPHASLLFQAICERYEKQQAIVLTSNKAFADWGQVFAGDAIMASAALDRLLHRSTVINIRRESYRLKEKRHAKAAE